MQLHFTIRTVGCCHIWLKKTAPSLSFSHELKGLRSYRHVCRSPFVISPDDLQLLLAILACGIGHFHMAHASSRLAVQISAPETAQNRFGIASSRTLPRQAGIAPPQCTAWSPAIDLAVLDLLALALVLYSKQVSVQAAHSSHTFSTHDPQSGADVGQDADADVPAEVHHDVLDADALRGGLDHCVEFGLDCTQCP